MRNEAAEVRVSQVLGSLGFTLSQVTLQNCFSNLDNALWNILEKSELPVSVRESKKGS